MVNWNDICEKKSKKNLLFLKWENKQIIYYVSIMLNNSILIK